MAIVYYLFYPYVYCASLQKIYSSIFEFVVNMHRSTAVDLNFDLNFQLYRRCDKGPVSLVLFILFIYLSHKSTVDLLE
jgi:hypothetical protein